MNVRGSIAISTTAGVYQSGPVQSTAGAPITISITAHADVNLM